MTDTKADLRRALEAARTQVNTWQAVVDALERALSQDRDLDQMMALALEDDEFSKASATRAAASVLAEAGRPLHVKEIIGRMIKRGYQVKDPRRFYTILYNSLRRAEKTFTRTGRATFALVERGKACDKP